MAIEKSTHKSKMCPSYVAKAGAQLFGVVNNEGNITYISTPLQVTEEFIQDNIGKTPLEQRFKFAGKCVEKGCGQWNNEKHECSLPKLVENLQKVNTKIGFCAIRNSCRWFSQENYKACLSCNEVLRNMQVGSNF